MLDKQSFAKRMAKHAKALRNEHNQLCIDLARAVLDSSVSSTEYKMLNAYTTLRIAAIKTELAEMGKD